MKRFLLASTLMTGALAAPALAFDINEMSPEERAGFGEEVRAYLMENPEVLLEAIAVLEERQQQEQETMDVALVQAHTDELFNDGYSWVGGNLEGDLTIVEFVDYRCGYCRKAHEEVKQLVEQDGNIRLILKEFPILGQDSVLSSRFAIAVMMLAGPDAYEVAHDALMTFRGEVTPDTLAGLAETLGHDPDQIIEAMNSEQATAIIGMNHGLGGAMQISGTPTFVVGDELLRGYLPLEGMQEVVAQVRSQ